MNSRELDPVPQTRDLRWLRLAIAAVWLLTGVGVATTEYRRIGGGYLTQLGLPHWLMYAACALEIALGLYVALRVMTHVVAALQIALIVGFTVVLVWVEPMLAVHPLGVLTKNIPIVVAVVVATRVEGQRWSATDLWLLRGGMAAIWITEGLFPKILFLSDWEVAFAETLGLPATSVPIVGAVQLVSGLAVLVLRGQLLRYVLAAQIAALVVLPALVGLVEPSWWLHPFGPLTKTLPIAVGTIIIWRRCTSTLV